MSYTAPFVIQSNGKCMFKIEQLDDQYSVGNLPYGGLCPPTCDVISVAFTSTDINAAMQYAFQHAGINEQLYFWGSANGFTVINNAQTAMCTTVLSSRTNN